MSEDGTQEATIVYEGADGEPTELTVENRHIAYFQDHWIVRVGETDESVTVRRIPRERVHHVERSVGEFREEVETLATRVESFAADLRERLLGDEGDHGGTDEPHRIDIGDE